uniref:Ionotropic glutamate receptor L-glutamate and glycine-binding domain-containing protein n=1 Tax=Strigamia maritima TaxID=126957 RepID=T1JPF7_STRMM
MDVYKNNLFKPVIKLTIIFVVIEFQYLEYKWLSIDAAEIPRKYSLLVCQNQSSIYSVPPLITLSHSLKVGGFFGQVFNIFHTAFNVSFKTVRTEDGQFGTVINGNWTGMMGDLVQGKADIAPGLVVTRRRSNYINNSPQVYPVQNDIIYKKITHYEWNYTFYFQPRTLKMWLCIFAISLAVILVKVSANNVLRKKDFMSNFRNFMNECVLCWPIVLQGNSIIFSLKSTKLMFAIYISFSMLILISYNSKLTSLLATPRMKIPFTSLKDMLENTHFLPVILIGHKAEEIFMNSTYENTTVKKVRTSMEAIESIYRDKLGYIDTLLAVENLIRGNCTFAVAAHFISRGPATLAYSKQFEYMEFFNSKILLLKQYGILPIEFKRFYPGLESCPEKPFNPISFGQIIGPFVLIMTGILIALLLGIIELIAYKYSI